MRYSPPNTQPLKSLTRKARKSRLFTRTSSVVREVSERGLNPPTENETCCWAEATGVPMNPRIANIITPAVVSRRIGTLLDRRNSRTSARTNARNVRELAGSCGRCLSRVSLRPLRSTPLTKLHNDLEHRVVQVSVGGQDV